VYCGNREKVADKSVANREADDRFTQLFYMEIVLYVSTTDHLDMTAEDTGADSWRQHTSAFDRVRSVALSASEPRTAGWIGEEAMVADNTARDHLERLVEMRMLQSESTAEGTAYYPDPVYVRTREIRALVEEHDRDQLGTLAADLQADIEEWADTYDSAGPDEVRAAAARAGRSAEAARECQRVASDWEHARYRLSLVEDALGRYGEFTGRPSTA
jgi:predicted ArsR family transcriptional regulator